jgi:hypothetical protein
MMCLGGCGIAGARCSTDIIIYSPRKTTEISIKIARIRTWDMTDTNPFTVRFGMLQAVSSTGNRNVLCQRQTEVSEVSVSDSCQGQGTAFISTEVG